MQVFLRCVAVQVSVLAVGGTIRAGGVSVNTPRWKCEWLVHAEERGPCVSCAGREMRKSDLQQTI